MIAERLTVSGPAAKLIAGEIDAGIAKYGNLGKFLRMVEVERALQPFGDHVFERALELGAGNAFQTEVIAARSRKLVCTDLNWVLSPKPGEFPELGLDNVEFDFCDALDLSRFEEHSFDLIFASHMFQQIPDTVAALKQCRRVLRPDGVLVFTTPNPTWRLSSAAIHALKRFRPARAQMAGKGILGEAVALRQGVWESTIKEAGFRLDVTIRMPFYAGETGLGVVKLGNKLGLSAARAYVVSAKD